jgi:hypothetical protein
MSDAGSGGASGADSGGVISGAGDGGEFSVVRRKLADNGLHVTVGLSRVESGGDRLYFVSQAGFFSTDEYFRSAAFICGDGPESYEKFVIAGGKVIFRKSGVSGKGGIYSMNLDGTAQVRLTDAEALDFAANGTDVYWLDADMHLFWLDALTGGRRQIGEWTADRIGLLDGGGILIRNAYDKFSLYLIDPVDGAGEKISAGSVGSFAAQGGQAAFCPWEASGSRFGAEYWLGMGI